MATPSWPRWRRAQLKRPVKVALTRQQMFQVTTHRAATIQRVRLARRPGRQAHRDRATRSMSQSARMDEFVESAAASTRSLYAAPNRLTRHRVVPLDLPVADSMRAPGEAVGLLALEQAMDELADKLDLDPVELRLRNEPDRGSREARALLDPPAGRVPAEGRRRVRLGQAATRAGQRAATAAG